MTDGRKHRPAHRAERATRSSRVSPDPARHLAVTRPATLRGRLAVPTVAALALGLAGTGAVAAPASAADLDAQVERAQAQVDRLDAAAEAQQRRLDKDRERTQATRAQVERLTRKIEAQREQADALRARLAQGVLVEQDAAPVAASTTRMSETSEQLLVGLATVTEDAGDTASALVEAEAAQARLSTRRDEVRTLLDDRRAAASRSDDRAERAGAELGAAQGRLAELQDKLAAESSRSAVDFAMAQVGKSYVWGAAGPDSFDCSGLTMAAWATEGVSLPHNSQAQYAAGTPVSESELQPGDLVFYYSPISHVGIYVGDGQIVNALNPGSGVQISGLHDMPYSGAVRPG